MVAPHGPDRSAAPNEQVWGRYRITEAVGRGSSGRLLKVIDAETGEARALQIASRSDRDALRLEEFEQLARLRHACIPRVFEVGRTQAPIEDAPAGSPFFLSEWIAGGRCDAQIWSGPDTDARIWALLGDVTGALATMHAAGLIHGDVAPQNIVIADDGRAVLVGLGLGTPVYMAPEALAGDVEPRSDLYGLAATVVRLVTGRPLFEAASLGEVAQRVLAGGPPPELPGLARPLADLVGRMVARDADARPGSAVAVLDELDRLASAIAPGWARRVRPRVAPAPAPVTWPGAAVVIDAIARSLGGSAAAIVVIGNQASGAHELVGRALRRHQVDQVARGAHRGEPGSAAPIAGSLDEVGCALAVAVFDPASARGWIERVARAARRRGAPVVIELGEDPRAPALIGALARAEGGNPVIAIIDGDPGGSSSDDASPSDPAAASPGALAGRPGITVHVAPTLDADGVATLAGAMLGTAPPRAWAHALRAASSGLALSVVDLVRSIAGEPQPFAVDWTARTAAGFAELRARQLRAAPAGARRVAAAVAAWGGRARIDRALQAVRTEGKQSATLGDAAELERLGLAHRRGDEVTIDRATADAAEAIAGSDAIARLAGIALDAALREIEASRREPPERGADLPVIAPLLERAALDARSEVAGGGDRDGSAGGAGVLPRGIDRSEVAGGGINAGPGRVACDAAEHLLARGRPDRALGLARRALAIDPARAGLVCARAATALGAYDDAAAYARDAEAAGADPVLARLIRARAAQRAGELDRAEATLAELHAAHPRSAEVAGAYARLLVTRSRHREARAVATRGGPLAGLRAEAAGLAAFYLGELEAADAAFAALEVGAAASGDGAAAGRASSLRGMVAQQRGLLGLAGDRYREAARRLSDAGELHAAATAELNLGTVLIERGRASEALPRLTAAGRVFAELGATTKRCAAELTRGDALLRVGQVDEARAAAETAVALGGGAPRLRALGLIVVGDARKRLGDEAGAIASYREALAIAAQRGDAQAQISAHIALAEAGQREAVASPESPASPASIAALCTSNDDRDRWTLARGRLALRDPASLAGGSTGTLAEATVALARACAEVAVRAADADRLERAFRGHALAAQLAQRARDHALGVREAERARVAHAAWIAATAPAFRAALDGDPDLARLPGGEAAISRPARPAADPETAQLRRLLTLSRRLHSEASVERVLDDVIDTAVELTCAERGFVVLRQASGELAVVVSRNFLAGDLELGGPSPGAAAASRSIAERAAQTGEPMLTADAGIDERVGAGASVAALRLRSVLAVPLRLRDTVIGCIYVDHRLRGGAFDDAASVLGELAGIAAIAIDNARRTGALAHAAREADALNRRLASELTDRDAELVRVKSDLPDRDRLRHRHDRIIGRAPATVRLLGVVDRAAATSLPVVIVGESGTGKELIARTLHDHGPRKAGPFVAIHCGAVPEPLLESELFGRARGSQTGADRDHRGLLEVADGGTLFLDEIAELGPAMQARLLRVLHDGVIRGAGESRTREVDVRLIAASTQPLAELVAAGRFREDLRLAIDAISVAVPPLRERDGDLPLLIDHLLARLCAGRPVPRLTRAALRALSQHRWPGNVRELENALARGVAMGGDVIDVADLPDAIVHVTARPEPARPAVGEDLRLRPALAATEHAYVTAAMARAKGNQTAAARLLGLSRFGLQKKLARLARQRDED